MAQGKTILSRTIRSRDIALPGGAGPASLRLISALPAGDGRQARLFFDRGEGPGAAGSADVLNMRSFSGALLVDMRVRSNEQVASPFDPAADPIVLDRPESDLFRGRNVMLGHCNGEDAATVCDWLIWHRLRHGADAALIVHRGRPGAAALFGDQLQTLLESSDAGCKLLAETVLMVVDFDVPLGDAAKGAEAHPMNAPDAPGKDRMDAPAPAPWEGPLAYKLLFDLLRHRFLSDAGAVANVEVIDLVAADDDLTIFDRARGNARGFVPLKGRRIYPWNIRNDARAGFFDHICTRFDSGSTDWRWCAALDSLPTGTTWLRDRILGSAHALQPASFDRHMALRHGREDAGKVGRIVPKTSLVEDDDLVARALAQGADPLRVPAAPAIKVAPHAPDGSRRDRVAIVTTMKNEGPFILEWLAYHRAIGIRDFLIYTNDCTDGTDRMLRMLADKGYCEWRENPYRETGIKPQHAALQAADNEAMVKAADWLICMDVDEYIAVHVGDGTIGALFDAVPDANLISLTWRLFGNADITDFRDGFITQQFFRCAREFANKPHQAWGFKTLYRNIGLFKKMGVHRPKGLQPGMLDAIDWVNGSGKPMPRDQWRTAWRSHSDTYGYDLVSLNHYAVRSAESFLVKRDRGRVNHVDRDQGMAYWFRMNHNVVQDRRMERMQPLLRAEYDRVMSDPEIRAMHESCVAAHVAKINELKGQPNYSAFFAELRSERMRKLSTLHGHFGSNVYLAGPSVIPDRIVEQPADSEFFFTVDRVETTEH
ncbi:glycosyltransferase family 2 protein [Paracoccus sp. 1_MG-2023]|uniref:glycosyltransferase family 2 protein n=1 Tax=unclassified Paracoccus (in: a-proteobacteria) TaxID=2688777 RepID=UPI0020915E55|nr:MULTISPECIES: glycosyltransferase family 2 protein [unclassified Paracoccus (in: a-proteobacteria)]MDO6670331.1 glycosyltransferase family 2 protein [Paracoccus sp. 1_MG-2023]